VDEYRYHEALVHPALATIPSRERILVLGGGDGLGVREILRYPDVKEIVLVDIDKEMVELCRTNVHLRQVNQGALDSPKLRKVYRDAWAYVREARGHFNAIIVDFPDPSNEKVAKLYSLAFYRQARHLLAADGVMAVQSTSPYFSPGAFWCIHRTLKEAGLTVVPIHAYVPTFGQWGFNLASLRPLPYERARLPAGLRYVGQAMYPGMFLWPEDEGPVEVDISTLDNPRVVHYYDQGFRANFRTRTGGTGRRGSRQ
jgi:spermidine synthase